MLSVTLVVQLFRKFIRWCHCETESLYRKTWMCVVWSFFFNIITEWTV